MSRPVENRAVPPTVERFVRQLVAAYKAVVLYPPASEIPRESAGQAVGLLDEAVTDASALTLSVSKEGLAREGVPVLPGQIAATTFARELYHRSVVEVRFHAGVTDEAVLRFLALLREEPEHIEAAGGFSARLWDEGVDSLTVVESTTSVLEPVPEESEDEPERPWPPDHERIEHLVANARDPRADGHRVLVRVLGDPAIVSPYVAAALERASDPRAQAEAGTMLAVLARTADALGDEDRAAAFRALAASMSDLPAGRPRFHVVERVLSTARTDRAVAALVRQMGVDEVCRVLTEEAVSDEETREGLARAIRNLAQISLAARDEVENAAGAAMRTAGFAEASVSAVLETALPRRLLPDTGGSPGESSDAVESVLRLVEFAAGPSAGRDDDPGLSAIREEANRGFRDADVVGALATLAALDLGTPEFAQSIAALEDGLGLLLERGEFEAAAQAAEALVAAAEEAPAAERELVVAAVGRLAGPRELRALHRALHVYERDSRESVACRRLLKTLGVLAIDPLLEMLADEPDMALRKSLVALISSVADRHVNEVGHRVTDPRWYFVRNVVSILGSTKSSESIPFLDRTVRHADARVRRESIRALAGVPDPRAVALIAVALSDADTGNVQLAARYLGSTRSPAAVPALLEVARGEGQGSREHGPRAEAIEALGAIGSPEALPDLESLAGRRRLVGGGQAKGLAAVAAAAIAAIESAAKEGGR